MRYVQVRSGLVLLGLICLAVGMGTATSHAAGAADPAQQSASENAPVATSTPCSMSFSDVRTTDYFYNDVHCVYCLGAISGYTDGTFRPYANTTRGQLTKIIVLALRIPIIRPPGTPTALFRDVPVGSPFYSYVQTAATLGIVSGYTDGTFRPNANVTRGQLSKIVVTAANRVYGWPIINPTTTTFSDVTRDNPFFTYIETAVCRLVISGYSDATFRPSNNAIRAQIAKIVCHTAQNPPDICGVAKPGVAPQKNPR